MDIYKPYLNPQASQTRLVNVGRITAATALVIALCIAPMLGGLGQVFQYIQEYTGLVSPGILGVFLMGLFWKGANNKGAVWGVLLSIPVALLLKFLPAITGGAVALPFLDQMAYTLLATLAIICAVSKATVASTEAERAIPITKDLFKTDSVFNICAYVIMVMLAIIYAIFW